MDDNPTSEGASTGSAKDTINGEEKIHPSEYLEFTTIHDTVPGHHVRPIRPSNETDDGSPDEVNFRPTVSMDNLYEGLSQAIPNLRRLSADARFATEVEHKMTFMEGCRLYPKAMAWSALLSATIIMEGYSTTLVSSFFGFPEFRRRYGRPADADGRNHQITPQWQAGLQNGMISGEIIGLFFQGFLTDRFGYHKTITGALVATCVFVFLSFFAVNIQMLLSYQILCGVPWGIFQTLSMTYAAEIMPITLRGYLLSNVNMCWLVGQILAVGIIRGLINMSSQWSYRIPFGLQWVFAALILIGVVFAPESPWWLVRKGRLDEAKKSLQRLTTKGIHFNVDHAVAMLHHTNEVEKYLDKGGMSWADCFRGTNLRRTEIASMTWATQALCGLSLTGFAAYYYEQAGFSTANAFTLSVGMYGLAILGGILSWALLPRVGRRTLYLVGLVIMQFILIAAGIIGTTLKTSGGSWAVGSLLIALTFVYDVTVGPVCYVLVAELPSTRLRIKTVVIARVVYNLISLVTNVLTARMLNPLSWNWGPKSNFVYAGTNLVCLIWCYFRLPETRGLSYLELDILFTKKAKTKKFSELRVLLAETGYFSLARTDRSGSSAWQGY